MGVEGLVDEGSGVSLADRVKESAERGEKQKAEKDEARKARQVRLGHVEKPKAKSKPKAEEKSAETT